MAMWDPLFLPLDESRACAVASNRVPRNRDRLTAGYLAAGSLSAGYRGIAGVGDRGFGVYELYKKREELRRRRKVVADDWGWRNCRLRNDQQVLSFGEQDLPSLIETLRSALLSKRYRLWNTPADDFMWVDRNGRPVSPPTNHPRSPTFRKVIVSVEDGLSLGLMIRGGAEYGLGIYITGVDEASAADLAGLQFGDRIISVNDLDFTQITHDEAVTLLQTSLRMSLVVRGEGKVPHSTPLPSYIPSPSPDNAAAAPSTSAAEAAWYGEALQHRSQLSRKGSPRKRDLKLDEALSSSTNPNNAERRLDRKARKLLNESQRLTLAYYCNEYETGAISVGDFVAALLDQLIDTHEKFSLMSDIRALVPSEDIDKFDELIYRREMQAIKSKEAMKLAVEIHTEHADSHVASPGEILRISPRNTFRASTRRRQQQQDKHHLTVPTEHDHPDDLHTPSEDSGVDLANGGIFGHGSRKGSRVSTGSRDSISLDTKSLQQQHQRKTSPCRLWRTSPRTSRRSLDAMTSSGTRLRRTTFRRHSSGGEGGDRGDEGGRRPRYWSHEDRRWSIGSEMVDTPYVEGHLDAARAVLSRLKAIALTQRRRSPVSPRSPLSRSPVSRSPVPRSPVPRSPVSRSPVSRSPVPRSPVSRSPRLSPSSPDSLHVPHVRVRRHRSLPDPHAIQARKKQQQLERLQQQRSASVRLPGHRTIPEGNGRFRIIVKKTRPLLGIAIEGGADTTQPLPRIISIHNAGAAFDAGGLKVGHIILEVDGVKMSKRPHSEVAQLIAHAFYGTDKDQVEFVVVETCRNMESEVRRTSIMVFE